MRTIIACLVLSTSLLTGCATATSEVRSTRGSSASDMLQQEEILNTKASNVYDAVRRLRPRWLSAPSGTQSMRGGGTPKILVYEGAIRLGEVGVLRNMPLSSIFSMRYLRGTDATQLVGTPDQWIAGVIIIETVGPKN